MYDAGVEYATAPLWMSEDNLRNQLVLSFCYVGSWDQTQVTRLGAKCL